MNQHAAYAWTGFAKRSCLINLFFPVLVMVIVMIPLRSSPWTALPAVGSLHSEYSGSSRLLMSYVSSTLPGRSSRSHTCTATREREQIYFNK